MVFVLILIALFVFMIISLVYDNYHFRHLLDVAPDAILYKATHLKK